jgi:hypothetical protein
MGLFDDVKQTAKLAKTVWEADERWARIVAIESRKGPYARIRLEIHREGREPYQHVASTIVPRDVQPAVGMEVAIVNRTGPGSTVETWGIKWHEGPQYGHEIDAMPMSQEIVAGVMQAQEQIAQSWVAQNPAAVAPPAPDAAQRAARLAALRAQGVISQAEYAEAIAPVPAAPPTPPPAELPLIGPAAARAAALFRPTTPGESIPPDDGVPAARIAPAGGPETAERAVRLAQLRAQGVISADEYEQAIARLQPPG